MFPIGLFLKAFRLVPLNISSVAVIRPITLASQRLGCAMEREIAKTIATRKTVVSRYLCREKKENVFEERFTSVKYCVSFYR